MRAGEFITLKEVADQPYRYMLAKRTDKGNQYIFMTEAGTRMMVSMSRETLHDDRTRVEIGFAEQTPEGPTIDKTGKGDAFRVFATVAAIVKDYIKSARHPIDELTFTGKTKDPSRIRLYDRIARSLPKSVPGFTFKGEGSDGVDKIYYFEKSEEIAEDSGGFRTLWHVSRKRNRNSILAIGLEPRNQEYTDIARRPGVYMFESAAQAKEWAFWSSMTELEPHDVWQIVVPSTYKLIRDTHHDMDVYNAVIGYETIPPEQLTLIKTQGVPRSSKRAPKLSHKVPSDIMEADVSGDQLLDVYHKTHWEQGGNPEMEQYIKDHTWTLTTIEPEDLPSEEEFWDSADPFNRVIDLDDDQVEKYARKLMHDGIVDPIIMGPNRSIIDGNHRAMAAKRVGVPIKAYVPVEKLDEAAGSSMPVICVDVQPEYSGMNDGDENPVFPEIIEFVTKQTGPVLMLVNAEQDGLTGDTVAGIREYWEDTVRGEDWDEDSYDASPIDWSRFTIIDKGYGYLRSWMDADVAPAAIIRTIREMYRQRVSDSRELFGGEDSEGYEEGLRGLLRNDFKDFMLSDPLIVNWLSVAKLRKFNGAYIVGGGRNECLREVELLMSAFNIKYKRIDHLIY